MTRPTRVIIHEQALVHNARQVKSYAPGRKIIAMVKANAYGCGLSSVVPVLEHEVDAFGVASLEEAIQLRKLGCNQDCILFQGVFSADELTAVMKLKLQVVVHQPEQIAWIVNQPLPAAIKVWLKVNTGMNRLGFEPTEALSAFQALSACKWVDEIGLMTHLGCADEPHNPINLKQLATFNALDIPRNKLSCSIANSAAIIALPDMHADVVRPGIMLYGVSPFVGKTGYELGLQPVMQLKSSISAIHAYQPNSPVGYGGTWQSDKPSVIGTIPVGYGDGYPRALKGGYVWVNGFYAPVIGRVSMDMLTIDLTLNPQTKIGDQVELWGKYVPIEHIAKASGQIPYELLCTVTPRVRF